MHCGRSLALCAFVALSLLNGIVSSRGIVLPRQDSGSSSAAAISRESTQTSNIIHSVTDVKPTATDSSVNREISATKSTTKDTVPTGTSTNTPAPSVAGSYDSSNGKCLIFLASEASDELIRK